MEHRVLTSLEDDWVAVQRSIILPLVLTLLGISAGLAILIGALYAQIPIVPPHGLMIILILGIGMASPIGAGIFLSMTGDQAGITAAGLLPPTDRRLFPPERFAPIAAEHIVSAQRGVDLPSEPTVPVRLTIDDGRVFRMHVLRHALPALEEFLGRHIEVSTYDHDVTASPKYLPPA